MIRNILLGLFTATLVAAPAAWAQDYSSSHRQFYGGDYQVVSRMNGLCLNVSGGLIHEGALLITWDCVGAANERFRAQRHGDQGWMRLTIAGPDGLYCVRASIQQGRQMRLARCGGEDQTFRFTARPPFAVESSMGYCLNIEGQRLPRGTPVISWRCSGEPNEAWEFRRVY